MSGVEMISKERERLYKNGGVMAIDKHTTGQLVAAAVSCAMPWRARELWPWNWDTYMSITDPIKQMAVAGAYLAAEIDRLQRKQEHERVNRQAATTN